ncbi:MAG: hypothetical protein ACHQVS_03665 [Candidatus Babeliales bacterium]
MPDIPEHPLLPNFTPEDTDLKEVLEAFRLADEIYWGNTTPITTPTEKREEKKS